MLESLRGHLQSWPVRVLLLLLIVAFAVWGIGDVFRSGGRGDTVATVGSKDITVGELRRAFERDFRELQDRMGGLDRRQAMQLGLMQQTLQTLIVERLVAAHAAELGVAVADATLAERLHLNPLFHGAQGFDRERVAMTARSLGLSEDGYLELLRADMLRRDLLTGMMAPVAAPLTMVGELWRHANESRRGRALVVRFDAMPVAEPDEATLAAYLEETKDRWQTPERRTVTLALLRPADLADEIAVEEDAVRDEYEVRLAEFRTPERREVSQILAPDEATAKEAAALVAEGASFAEAAAALAEKGVTSDTLGAMTREQLPPELAEAIYALSTGEVGQPVQSPFGWHLFRLDAVEPARTTPLEAVKDQLARQLALQKAADRLPAFADRLDDAIAGGASLEEAAAEAGADVRKLEAVDRLGRDRDGASLLADGLTAEIVAAAFEAAEAEVPRLGETPEGGYYMLRVDHIEPARTRPLDAVREQLAEVWKAAQRAAAAEAAAKALLEQARAGQSLEALQAATAGSELRPVGPVRRDEPSLLQGLDAAALALLFRTEPGGVAAEVVRMRDGVALLAVDAVERPAPPADLAAQQARLTNELRGDLLMQYEAALRLRYQPRVNEGLLASMIQAEES